MIEDSKKVSTVSSLVSNGNTSLRDKGKGRNRSSSWCFTLNNYNAEEVSALSSDVWSGIKLKKCVFQKELGKNNTKHLQGVVQFKNQVSFSTMKNINERCHWTRCRDLRASIKYCSKQETRDEGCVYWYGVGVEKLLWKDKEINTMKHSEMLDNLRDMMIEDSKKPGGLHDKLKDKGWCSCLSFGCDCQEKSIKRSLGFDGK